MLGAEGLGGGGQRAWVLGAQRQPPAASIRASGPTAEPLRTRNSIHMANSFTLSSSKGCFVKACLMLKDASGSLSPLSKPISPSLGPWGFAYRPTQTNYEMEGGWGLPDTERGSQIQRVLHAAWSPPCLWGVGDSALQLPQTQLLSPTTGLEENRLH